MVYTSIYIITVQDDVGVPYCRRIPVSKATKNERSVLRTLEIASPRWMSG